MIDKRLRWANHCKITKEEGGTWSMVKEPIAKKDVMKHYTNGSKVGVPFIKQGGSATMLGMIDLDDHSGTVGWDSMLSVAFKIVMAAEKQGLMPNPFRSGGGKGINLWFAWEEPQDAHSVRETLRHIVESCHYAVGSGGVDSLEMEVFPKQDKVGVNDNGNCAAVPYLKLDPLDLEDLEPLGVESGEHEYELLNSRPVAVIEKSGAVVEYTGVEQLGRDEIDDLLGYIDPAGMDQDNWFRVIAAIRNCGGGFDQAVAWTDRDEVWAGRENEWKNRFFSFNRVTEDGSAGGEVVGAGTLRYLAHSGGWEGVGADLMAFPEGEPLALDYARDKNGRVLATIENACLCISLDESFPYVTRYDKFFGEIVVIDRMGGDPDRFNEDRHLTGARRWWCRNGWHNMSVENTRAAYRNVADELSGDLMLGWLEPLVWDGVDRIGRLVSALGLSDEPYERSVVQYMLTALVARQYDAGCQVDITPILVGAQGIGKTTAVQALAPSLIGRNTFVELGLKDLVDGDKAARMLRGRTVVCLDELRGKKTEREALKAALTRTIEEHRLLYSENVVQFKRRCLIIGTTNEDEFLDDPTGARRYAPVRVRSRIDVGWIRESLDQLWAQGKDLYQSNGIMWKQVQELASEIHEEYRVSDSWEDAVCDYLDRVACVSDGGHVTVAEVLGTVLGIPAGQRDRSKEMRVSAIFKTRGLRRVRLNVDGGRVWAYKV